MSLKRTASTSPHVLPTTHDNFNSAAETNNDKSHIRGKEKERQPPPPIIVEATIDYGTIHRLWSRNCKFCQL